MGARGRGVLLMTLAVLWPVFVYGGVRGRFRSGGAAGGRKRAGSGTLGAPASARGPAGEARAAAVITATPGQRCARCGSVIRDVARAWGTGAVFGGCASDLGVAN